MPEFEVFLIDIIVLVVYILLARFVPLWFAGAQEDADDFFLGGRDFIRPLIGFSLFATNRTSATGVSSSRDRLPRGWRCLWPWAPQIARFETLWGYLQSVLAYTTPPIVATFVGGIFWKRANRHGAFATLLLGVSLGVLFFVLNEILGGFAIQFLYAAGISLVMSVIILVGVSLATAPPPGEKTGELTWDVSYWHAETEELKELAWWQNYRYHSLLLVFCTAVILYFFA